MFTVRFLFLDQKKMKNANIFLKKHSQVCTATVVNTGLNAWEFLIKDTGADEKDFSKVIRNVYQNYKPLILQDDLSAKYNQELYPLMNEFERKLRELIYLARIRNFEEPAIPVIAHGSSKNDHETVADILNKIQDETLGRIFVALFVSSEFSKYVAKKLHKYDRGRLSKAELIDDLSNYDGRTGWGMIFDKKKVAPTLVSKFSVISEYRNRIMHAGFISYEECCECKDIIDRINSELDTSIQNLKNEIKAETLKESLMVNREANPVIDGIVNIGLTSELFKKLGAKYLELPLWNYRLDAVDEDQIKKIRESCIFPMDVGYDSLILSHNESDIRGNEGNVEEVD